MKFKIVGLYSNSPDPIERLPSEDSFVKSVTAILGWEGQRETTDFLFTFCSPDRVSDVPVSRYLVRERFVGSEIARLIQEIVDSCDEEDFFSAVKALQKFAMADDFEQW